MKKEHKISLYYVLNDKTIYLFVPYKGVYEQYKTVLLKNSLKCFLK